MHKNREAWPTFLESRGGGRLSVGIFLAALAICASGVQCSQGERTLRVSPAVAAMPLEEKIHRILVARWEPEFAVVTAGAFDRTARQNGLRLCRMQASAVGVADDPAAGVRALTNGCDALIDVSDADATFWAIASAVERGELTLDRLDAAVARLLRTMREAGAAVTPRD